MHLSRYLRVWPDPDGGSLLFSTRKGSVARVPATVLAQLGEASLPSAAGKVLVRLGMLVADPAVERDEIAGYLERLNRLSPVVRVAVILGMGCNFACPYCYEGSLKGGDAMTVDTARQLVAFISDRLEPGKRRLTVDFYGGEPLLYVTRIRRVAAALQQAAKERDVEFSFTLVSNGSLLTADVVEGLLPLGLSGAKLTLDGPAEVHDRSRPLRSGRGTFSAIVENLRNCCGRLRIGLAGNYTRESWPRFVELLDGLEAAGLGPEQLAGVKFDPVMQTRDRFANPEFGDGCASVNEPWLVESSVVLRGEILKRGYHTPRISPLPCMVDRNDAFAVNWDGTLTRCTALIGHDEFVVGDVWNGFTKDVAAIFGGPRWKTEENCRDCAYLPLCFGGCRYMQFQREGNMTGVECQKAFFDATLEPMIRQDMAYRWGTAGTACAGSGRRRWKG